MSTEDDLHDLLRRLGLRADAIDLPPSFNGPGHRGFGFLTFADAAQAADALAVLGDGVELKGRTLRAEPVRERGTR
jgi:hypothetical protein